MGENGSEGNSDEEPEEVRYASLNTLAVRENTLGASLGERDALLVRSFNKSSIL